jgi:hypothetical protein
MLGDRPDADKKYLTDHRTKASEEKALDDQGSTEGPEDRARASSEHKYQQQ